MTPRLGALRPGQDRAAMIAAVREALGEVLALGARAGVAVSGGRDSVGLAVLARAARPDLDLRVLHVRHGLRDDAADADVATAVAGRLGLPATVRAVQVVDSGEGPEASARRARYAALADLVAEHSLAAVLLGHTADDQAETVLLNLVRGSGVGGLAGMRPVARGNSMVLVRPLLGLRRQDVRSLAEAEGLPSIEDPTNRDPGLRRARARHDVLPGLRALAGGPGDPVAAIARLAALAAADDELLERQAAAETAHLWARLGRAVVLPWPGLAALPVALRRRVVRAALADARGRAQGLSAADVEAALDLADGQRVSVAGAVAVSRSAGWLVVGGANLPLRKLPVRGGVALPELGAVLTVAVAAEAPAATAAEAVGGADKPDGATVTRPPWWPLGTSLHIPAEPAGWLIRARRPGERLRTGGRLRAIAELQRAAGVPTGLRDLLPVVLDSAGEPVWLPGTASRDGLGGAGGGWTLRLDSER